jgi:DNA-binding MarR family transcriptional regulator
LVFVLDVGCHRNCNMDRSKREMKPQSLIKYYKNNFLDLIADQVLQEVVLKEPTTVQKIVNSCLEKGISSPATTHKKLSELKKADLIQKHLDLKDQRISIVQATEEGRVRLKKWGKR